MTLKKKSKKTLMRELKRHNETLLLQITAMQKTLWAVVYQEGQEYTIRPDVFDKAHTVAGRWETKMGEDGSFTIKVMYDNETVDGEGKADEILTQAERVDNL